MSKDKNKLIPELRFPEFVNEGERLKDDRMISSDDHPILKSSNPKKLSELGFLGLKDERIKKSNQQMKQLSELGFLGLKDDRIKKVTQQMKQLSELRFLELKNDRIKKKTEKMKHEELKHKIIGCAMKVHSRMIRMIKDDQILKSCNPKNPNSDNE